MRREKLEGIGIRLRLFRDHHGWTRKEMQSKCGVSSRQVQHIENGTRDGGLRALKAMCDALGVSLGSIIAAAEADICLIDVFESLSSGQVALLGLQETKRTVEGVNHAEGKKAHIAAHGDKKGKRAGDGFGPAKELAKARGGRIGKRRVKGGAMLKTAPAPSYSSAQIETIRQSICPGATDEELALFLQICASSGLSPFTRDVYAIRTGGRLSFIISIDGYRKIAHNSEMLHSISAPDFELNESGGLISATVTVLRYDDRENLAEYKGRTYWEEYGSARGPWGKMPRQMLGKTAEAQALRRAFALELSGTYTADEMPEEKSPSRPSEIKVAGRDVALENDRFNRLNNLWQNARGRGWTPEHMRTIKGEILGDDSLTVKDFTDEQFDLIIARIQKEPPGGV